MYVVWIEKLIPTGYTYLDGDSLVSSAHDNHYIVDWGCRRRRCGCRRRRCGWLVATRVHFPRTACTHATDSRFPLYACSILTHDTFALLDV